MVNVMKKILLILTSFIMLFTLSGCESEENYAKIYGVVSKNDIREINYQYEKDLNITNLASSISFWTGLDFYLETSEPNDNTIYVNFLASSTFVKGLSNDYKNSVFSFKNNDEMRLFMLNSISYTIRKNIKECDIYFTADGKSINDYLKIDGIDFNGAYNKIENDLVIY